MSIFSRLFFGNRHGERDIEQAHKDRRAEREEQIDRAQRECVFEHEQEEIERARRRLDFIMARSQQQHGNHNR